MGGFVRKEGPVVCEGDESFVLARRPERDAQDGWSVTLRPYRQRPADELLQDLSSDTACTCLLAGNRVLMEDRRLLPIERVREGDRVMTMSGPAAVLRTETARLGMTRKAIEIRGIGDECLILTDDHPLWVSRRAADGRTRECWGTYNLHHVLYEMRQMVGYDLAAAPVPLNFDLPEQVAHVSGWLHVRPIYLHLDPQTPVHHLVVEGAFSFIAEGFAVFSHCQSSEGPSSPWHGLTHEGAASRFLEQLTTSA